MPIAIPDRVQLKIVHTLKWEAASRFGNTARHTYRETTQVVERPRDGAAEVSVACGECGHRHEFRVVDRAQTQRLRVRSLGKPVVASVALAALLFAVFVTGLIGSALVMLVAFLAAIGLLVAVVSVFAFYLDEIGVTVVNRRRISVSGTEGPRCLATAQPLRRAPGAGRRPPPRVR